MTEADVTRSDGAAGTTYSHQVQICLDVLADLIDDSDSQAGKRDTVLTLSALVGAISIARAVDDPACPNRY